MNSHSVERDIGVIKQKCRDRYYVYLYEFVFVFLCLNTSKDIRADLTVVQLDAYPLLPLLEISIGVLNILLQRK